jgi:putative transposase
MVSQTKGGIMDYRYGSHTVLKIQYHFVFVTKYRYKVLKGDAGLKVRELDPSNLCEAFEIRILKGVVSPDHVYIFVSAPPVMAPSELSRMMSVLSNDPMADSFAKYLLNLLVGVS